MKKDNIKWSSIMLKDLTIGLLFLLNLIPAHSFADDNGQGVNGTQFKGEALPESMDRLIELKDIEMVYNTCLSTLSYDIANQIDGGNCTINKEEDKSKLSNVDERGNYSYKFGYTCGSQSKVIYLVSLVDKEYMHYEHDSRSPVSGKDESLVVIDKHTLKVPGVKKTFPYFTFSIFRTDFKYGDFGEVTGYKDTLKNLNLYNSVDDENIFLENRDTKAESKIMVNYKVLYQCMKSLRTK